MKTKMTYQEISQALVGMKGKLQRSARVGLYMGVFDALLSLCSGDIAAVPQSFLMTFSVTALNTLCNEDDMSRLLGVGVAYNTLAPLAYESNLSHFFTPSTITALPILNPLLAMSKTCVTAAAVFLEKDVFHPDEQGSKLKPS